MRRIEFVFLIVGGAVATGLGEIAEAIGRTGASGMHRDGGSHSQVLGILLCLVGAVGVLLPYWKGRDRQKG